MMLANYKSKTKALPNYLKYYIRQVSTSLLLRLSQKSFMMEESSQQQITVKVKSLFSDMS